MVLAILGCALLPEGSTGRDANVEEWAASGCLSAEEIDAADSFETVSTRCRPMKEDFDDEPDWLPELFKSIPKLLVHDAITAGSLPVRIRGSSDL
jgi:hypothetical protein